MQRNQCFVKLVRIFERIQGFNQTLVSKYSREILAPRVRDMDEVGTIENIDLCCLE